MKNVSNSYQGPEGGILIIELPLAQASSVRYADSATEHLRASVAANDGQIQRRIRDLLSLSSLRSSHHVDRADVKCLHLTLLGSMVPRRISFERSAQGTLADRVCRSEANCLRSWNQRILRFGDGFRAEGRLRLLEPVRMAARNTASTFAGGRSSK